MINKVVLVGRITKDPELRFVNGDIPLVRFNLAVNRPFTNSEGVRETDFIRCVVWNKQAENLAKYITKGALIGIEGKIKTSFFDNGTDKKQFTTEIQCDSIQFLESRKKKDNDSDYSQNSAAEEFNINEDDKFPF
ncbi:putative single-strand DNA-binding protein [Candidatus Phytoplasma pruni]|uniref:Single-stranded DNA-binding protein n=1 Tax=Candidatus Phytoplasma pruni TaxID=479893 RepID=A0A0M1MZV5_9MOLU|nr:single-stranded DNA-binding protein [Candidatus Phytoplasma pruni]KOR75428.1 putative single-strand DNA-binding protein [Candidatus Phytoplasma pruni]MCQ9618533.1 Single-stranded DNA binding protein [Candidatus Phytoplasma pruni]MDW3617521.1 single-stranded DNA-binding protein [Candidatus Phytoplasma pruni]